MAFALADDQKVEVSVQGMDDAGNPVTVDVSQAVWASSDPTIVSVGPDATGAIWITAMGPEGTATVTFTPVAGPVATVDVTVAGSAPATFALNLGAPVHK